MFRRLNWAPRRLCATCLVSSRCVIKFTPDFHCAFAASLDYTTSNRLDNAGSGARDGRAPEPALEPAGSKVSLLCNERLGWLLEDTRGFWAAQKVHVNASDLVMPELHVARASPLVSLG